MRRIDETVAVLVDQEGTPTLFRWREMDYQVSSRPVRWFARTEWCTGERAHRGIGSGAVEVEMWRLCVAEGRVFDLLHNTPAEAWKLVMQFE